MVISVKFHKKLIHRLSHIRQIESKVRGTNYTRLRRLVVSIISFNICTTRSTSKRKNINSGFKNFKIWE